MKKTYAEFVAEMNEWKAEDMIKHAMKPKGSSKGTKYTGAEADHDEDGDEKKAEPQVKRGRGRPAGSKSGANTGKNGGTSGATGEFHLSLPTKSVYY